MEVVANGRALEIDDDATVAMLLASLGLAGRVVVVERNGEPVERSALGAVVLRAGDRLEIVRAVAGG
jgi:sulfur carrier protein